MEAKINQFFDSVTNFFGGGDHIPWSTPDVILDETRRFQQCEEVKFDKGGCVNFGGVVTVDGIGTSILTGEAEKLCIFEGINHVMKFWNDPLVVVVGACLIVWGCEREVAEASKDESDERKNESIMRLSWALAHSRKPEDVQRGIAMLEASLTNTNSPLQKREKLYLLAVAYYRSGEYSRSRQLLDQCLEIAPEWRQALSLKKTVEDRITKDGVIGIGITATAVGLIAGGIAAALARKN